MNKKKITDIVGASIIGMRQRSQNVKAVLRFGACLLQV